MSERIGIQLAYPYEEKRLLKWAVPWIIQPKLDGERIRAIFDPDGKVNLLRADGTNTNFSMPIIVKELESLDYRNIELDGEAYIHGLEQNDLHSIISREVNIHPDANEVEYHIFDVIDENLVQEKRLVILDTLFSRHQLPHIHKVPWHTVYTVKDISLINDTFLKNGFEGFILRHRHGHYLRRRSTYMMKFKPKKMDCYQIVGFKEEMSKSGEPKCQLGVLICISNDGLGGTFGVGTGFTEEQRVELWATRAELVGKWCMVKYQHITSAGHVPCHPVFLEVLNKSPVDPNNYAVENIL